MSILIFLPILIFLCIYLGSGLYFTMMGVSNAFYQISPTVCILPCLFLGILIGHRRIADNINSLIKGMSHNDIITMCVIFLLSGAFSKVTESIGSIHTTVQMTLSIMPQEFLLIGVFLIAAFISSAIGTSMGVVALITPIAIGLAQQGAFPLSMGIGTVVGGAMFGDNLSLISDTTIAAVVSQRADSRRKFRLNLVIAIIASSLTIAYLALAHKSSVSVASQAYNSIKIIPYVLLLIAGICGLNVFVVLTIGLVSAGIIGMLGGDYSFVHYSQDIYRGFASVNEIMVLSLFIGGLSGLLKDQGATEIIFAKIANFIARGHSKRRAELVLCVLIAVFDLMIANNTIAIILTGDMGRIIAERFHIAAHRSAYLLDTCSCIVQGIIPHGAQILLASGLAGISPLSVCSHVYYCYILAIVVISDIIFRHSSNRLMRLKIVSERNN